MPAKPPTHTPRAERTDIPPKLIDLFVEQLGCDESEVTLDASIVDDLGADSLDLVELVMSIEDEYGIDVDDDDAEKMTHVRDVVAYVNALAKPTRSKRGAVSADPS